MLNYLFIRQDGEFSKISCADIVYVEALKKYVRIVTTKRTYLMLVSMRHVEEVLPTDEFCRIHRSYIVSLSHVIKFNNEVVSIGSKDFPIGQQYKGLLQKRVVTLMNEPKKMKSPDYNVADE